MKYKNPYYKKIKGSFKMVISCGLCKKELFTYQKIGKGGLLNMYLTRIIDGKVDLSKDIKIIKCPKCGNEIAVKINDSDLNKVSFKMLRSKFNTKRN
ncbi:MAG: hypothetical protein GX982_00015 [Tissierellia bacterium]|nr:hypothetical protein [Tissierellia bacterium]